MPASYKIDKRQRLVISSGSGVLTRDDCEKHQQQLLNDPDFDPGFSQLSDFTQVTKVALTTQDIQQLAIATIFSPGARRAFLAGSEEQFGLSRMFEMIRETMGETGVRVFRSREEAMRWLLKE